MDVAPDAEARVRGGERVVERPGDGPPRAGDLAAGGKAAEDVGRDGDRTAREFGGLRGARRDIEARGVQRDDGRREEGMWMSARRTGPSARGDPGGRNDRLGSRAGARRGGGSGGRREGVASMRTSRAPSARGRRLGGRAGTSRAPRAPRGSCARVGLSPRTRARTGRRAAGPRRRSTPPGARDHPRRTPSRGDPRTGGDARSARPGREASGSQTLPRVCRLSNRRAKIARQRHDIMARVMMRMIRRGQNKMCSVRRIGSTSATRFR